jgi:8-oxo-dGTP pyrophosphatase MutT (NUDIX family)
MKNEIVNTMYFRGESVFSAGGVLLNRADQKVLLNYKKEIDEWLLPKGHIESGETIEAAAQREIFEETGYENKVRDILAVQVRPDKYNPEIEKIIFWFFSELTNDKKQEGTQEKGEDYMGKWFTKEEALIKLNRAEYKKLVEKGFSLLV